MDSNFQCTHSDISATDPLQIVSFLLTPQSSRRTIPPTFSEFSRPREPERCNVRSESRTGRKAAREPSARFGKVTRVRTGEYSVQYLPGWTVQCISPECAARGHWLRASDSGGDLCSNCHSPLHNVPPPLGPRLRMRPRSLGSYRPPGRSPGRPR